MSPRRPVIERLMEKVVKDDEGCWIFTGATRYGGYGEIRLWPRSEGIGVTHRVVYEHLVGPIPPGVLLDHRCMKPRCCNPDHLRFATVKQNGEHRAGPRSDNKSSGVRGVTYDKRKRNPWMARVGHNGNYIFVGYFATIPEAEAAARAKRAELFTHDDHHEWSQR